MQEVRRWTAVMKWPPFCRWASWNWEIQYCSYILFSSTSHTTLNDTTLICSYSFMCIKCSNLDSRISMHCFWQFLESAVASVIHQGAVSEVNGNCDLKLWLVSEKRPSVGYMTHLDNVLPNHTPLWVCTTPCLVTARSSLFRPNCACCCGWNVCVALVTLSCVCSCKSHDGWLIRAMFQGWLILGYSFFMAFTSPLVEHLIDSEKWRALMPSLRWKFKAAFLIWSQHTRSTGGKVFTGTPPHFPQGLDLSLEQT